MYKKIYRELAEKYKLPVAQVQKICESQFEFTKEKIQEGGDKPVRLQFLGKFLVKPGRRAGLTNNRFKRAKAKEQRENDRKREEARETCPEGKLHT